MTVGRTRKQKTNIEKKGKRNEDRNLKMHDGR